MKYWIYRSLKGSGIGLSRVKGVIFNNLENAKNFVKKQDALYPNSEHIIIQKMR